MPNAFEFISIVVRTLCYVIVWDMPTHSRYKIYHIIVMVVVWCQSRH